MKKMVLVTILVFTLALFIVIPCYSQEDVALILGCYNKNVGQLRIVQSHSECRASELPIIWNQLGPPGPAGPQGPPGSVSFGMSLSGSAPYGLELLNSTGAGLLGATESVDGAGVVGDATADTGLTHGVLGVSESINGRGVSGNATATTGPAIGVRGQSSSTEGYGVYGRALATDGTNYGVFGNSSSIAGYDFYAGGAGVNYGPFTGAHEVKLAAGFGVEVLPGLLVSVTGRAAIRKNPDGTVNLSSTMPTVRLCSSANEKAVLGALVAETILPEGHWYESKEGERFATVNALGEGRVWVASINGPIEAGDYITTSSIPGYGQRQDDDLLHSYTVGKAIETVDWDMVIETIEFNGSLYKIYLIAVVYTSG
jgi:hypothetical protein